MAIKLKSITTKEPKSFFDNFFETGEKLFDTATDALTKKGIDKINRKLGPKARPKPQPKAEITQAVQRNDLPSAGNHPIEVHVESKPHRIPPAEKTLNSSSPFSNAMLMPVLVVVGVVVLPIVLIVSLTKGK